MDDINKKVTCAPKNKTNTKKNLMWVRNSFKYTARNNVKQTKHKLGQIEVFQEITTPSDQ